MPDLFQKFSLSVLQNICDSLASGHSYWDEHCHIVRQTLAALARTCRATHTPAVTALWRDILPHPALLLCTMPADAWQVQQISLFSVPYRVLVSELLHPFTSQCSHIVPPVICSAIDRQRLHPTTSLFPPRLET